MPTFVHEEFKAIFIHIPKSAGSSVTRALRTFEPKDGGLDEARRLSRLWTPGQKISGMKHAIERNDSLVGRKVSHPNHARAIDVRQAIGKAAFDSKYSFTFVRNPFDRIASTYHYIRRNPENPKNTLTMELGFEQYIVFNCLVTPQPQSDWICDLRGDLIVKDVLRVEDMGTVGAAVGQKIFGEPISFGQINKSKNASISKSTLWNVVPEWVVDLFIETYAEDFEKSGYSTDISSFKNADEESEAAQNGAWEALSRHLLHPVQMLNRANRNFRRTEYLQRSKSSTIA